MCCRFVKFAVSSGNTIGITGVEICLKTFQRVTVED